MSISARISALEQSAAALAKSDPGRVTPDEVLMDPEGARILSTFEALCRELSLSEDDGERAVLSRLADDPRGLAALKELAEVQRRVLAYRTYRDATRAAVSYELWRRL